MTRESELLVMLEVKSPFVTVKQFYNLLDKQELQSVSFNLQLPEGIP